MSVAARVGREGYAGHVLIGVASLSLALAIVAGQQASANASQVLSYTAELRTVVTTLDDAARLALRVEPGSPKPTVNSQLDLIDAELARIDPQLLTGRERGLLGTSAPGRALASGAGAVTARVESIAAARTSIDRRAADATKRAHETIRHGRLVATVAGAIAFVALGAAAYHAREHRRRTRRTLGVLDRLAHTDELTGLPNRRRWDQALRAAVERAGSEPEPLTVAIIDLDRFKLFNDAHGHVAGDDLLRDAAFAWATSLAHGDLLVRLGGEEFGLLLRGCDEVSAERLLDRLRASTPRGQTFSAGVATLVAGELPGELCARADRALYRAKHGGRARTVVASLGDLAPAAGPDGRTGVAATRNARPALAS